jgi:hypothetical protein
VTEEVVTQLKEAALSTGLVINKNKIHKKNQKCNKFRARSDNQWEDI